MVVVPSTSSPLWFKNFACTFPSIAWHGTDAATGKANKPKCISARCRTAHRGAIYKPKTIVQCSHHPKTERGTPHHVPQPRTE